MLNAHEQRLIAFYLSNAAARFHYRDPEATELVDWLACRENRLVFRDRRRRQADWEARPGEGLTARRWRSVQDMLRSELEALKGTRPDRTAQRLRRLGKTVGLTPTDVDILELLLRYQTQPVIEGMIEDIFPLTRRIGALNLKGVGVGRAARQVGAHGAVSLRQRQAAAALGSGQYRQGR